MCKMHMFIKENQFRWKMDLAPGNLALHIIIGMVRIPAISILGDGPLPFTVEKSIFGRDWCMSKETKFKKANKRKGKEKRKINKIRIFFCNERHEVEGGGGFNFTLKRRLFNLYFT